MSTSKFLLYNTVCLVRVSLPLLCTNKLVPLKWYSSKIDHLPSWWFSIPSPKILQVRTVFVLFDDGGPTPFHLLFPWLLILFRDGVGTDTRSREGFISRYCPCFERPLFIRTVFLSLSRQEIFVGFNDLTDSVDLD